MKKWISVLLVLVLCLGICACAPAVDNSGATTEGTSVESTGAQSTESSTPDPTVESTSGATEETVTPPATDATEAPEGKDLVYTKVTMSSAAVIKEGYYLLGGTSAYATDDGSTYAFLTGEFDSKGTRLKAQTLTVTGDTAATGDSFLVWKLIQAGDGFLVQNAGTGKYLYYGSNEGNAIFMTDKQSEAGVWVVVSHDDVWTLEETASGRQLSVNSFGSAGSKYLGVAAYSATGSTARSLDFYALTSGTVEPGPVEPETPTEAPTEKPTEAPTQAPTEKPAEAPDTGSDGEVTYVLNTNSKKFHDPDCGSAKKISEKNREETTLSRDELLALGYSPCGTCKP